MPEGKSEYSADIIEAADKAAASCWTGTSIRSRQARDAIVKALLAERQRCISICDAEREWGDFHPDDVTGRIQRGEGPRQIPGWNCPSTEES